MDVVDNSAKIATNEDNIGQNTAQITINAANITENAVDIAYYRENILNATWNQLTILSYKINFWKESCDF